MPRRKNDFSDSLDMLLDTVSNLFGCIIFLTLFVLILTGTSSVRNSSQSSSSMNKSLFEKKIELRMNSLKTTRDLKEESNIKILLSKINLYKKELKDADNWEESLLKKIEAEKIKIKNISKKHLTLKESKEFVQDALVDINRKILEVKSTIKENSNLPRFSKSGKKKSIEFWLKGGRMYDILNKNDCYINLNEDVYSVFLKDINRGLSIPPFDLMFSWDSVRWESILKNTPPETHQANFYISPDSVDEYLCYVKRFEKEGYSIRPTILSEVKEQLDLINVETLRGQ